ncbi:hypothetical protein GCM10010109_58710 [Actinoplanes campanulatus]|nr:hypothetical protein GCM10010109_58710 [Actinoplanes campanulatus]GID38856.1 hypothetical protein Aca09nite_53620 [Actinoplanes campanulatus]
MTAGQFGKCGEGVSVENGQRRGGCCGVQADGGQDAVRVHRVAHGLAEIFDDHAEHVVAQQ